MVLAILLLDENTSPRIVNLLWNEGVDAEHVRNRDLLQAPDHIIWRLANGEERTIVTINGKDFRKLAQNSERHAGVIVIPSGGNANAQFDFIMAAVRWVTNSNSQGGFTNRHIEVSENGGIVLAEIACKSS